MIINTHLEKALAPAVAGITTGILMATFLIYTVNLVPLYADGAHYLLNIIQAQDFFHVSPIYRIHATLLTQYPVVIISRNESASISALAYIYSASLMAIPILSLSVSTWLCSNNTIAASANLIVICAVFFPTSFIIIGEFHVLYALTWLSAVLLVVPDRVGIIISAILVLFALILVRSYEATLFLGPILAALCIWRMIATPFKLVRILLVVTALLLILSGIVGLFGVIFPRDATNAVGFSNSLFQIINNHALLALVALVAISVVGTLNRHFTWLLMIQALMLMLAWWLFQNAIQLPNITDLFSFGYQNANRAQVFPVLLLAIVLLFLGSVRKFRGLAENCRTQILFLTPLLFVFSMHLIDVREWQGFIRSMCVELEQPNNRQRVGSFLASTQARKFGWSWELPTLSILLRKPGSNRIISDPSHAGWQPFDPEVATPDITRYKQRTSLCPQ